MAKPPPIGGIKRAQNFFSRNKQAIINTLGVYFVFAYAVHNYRVKVAWDEREEEFRVLEGEFDRVRSTLISDAWTSSAAAEISNKDSKNKGQALLAEVQKVLQYTPPTAEERVATANMRKAEESLTSKAAGMIYSGAGVVGVGSGGTAKMTDEEAAAKASQEKAGVRMM